MPLIQFESILNGPTWGIWKIEESEEVLSSLLSLQQENEFEILSIRSLSKRIQMLAGRILVKELTPLCSVAYNGLIKNQDGKPFSKDGNYHVSISNTSEYCVAIINPGFKVGIDIESSRSQLFNIAPKFLNAFELNHFTEGLDQLCICWCVKEVVYKINGKKTISLKDHIHIYPFISGMNEGIIDVSLNSPELLENYKVKFLKFHQYYIAYNVL